MKITRKDFLRLSGLGLLAVAGKKAVRAITEAAPSATAPKKTKQWGMVIDLAKCRQEAGCTDCIKACNTRPQHSANCGPRSRGEVDLESAV